MKTNRASFSLRARRLAAAMALLQLTTLLPTAAYAQTVTDTDIVRRQSQYASVQQAVYQLVAEAADADADGTVETAAMKVGTGEGPADGGVIPDASGAPKTDGFGGSLGYCAWDNGVSTAGANYLPGGVAAASRALAVISYGLDNTFQTSCADAAAGNMMGDDYLFSMTLNQLAAGASATTSVYWGAPVANLAALNALNTAALHDGEARITKDTNQVYRWNQTTTTWNKLSAGGSQNWVDSGASDAYLAGKAAVGQGVVGAEALAVNGGAGVPVGLLGTGPNNGINIYNTAGSAVNAFLGYDNTASKLVLSAQTGGLSIQLGGAERMLVGADGSLTLNGSTILDAARNLSAANGTFTGSVNGASVQVSGTTVIDASRNLTNVGNITATGTVDAASFKINGVTVMDNSGAGTFATVASTGNATVGGTLTSTGALTANGGISTSGISSSGQVLGPVGTVGAPAFSFTGRTNTGVYSPAAATLGLSAGGAQVLLATATNLTLPVGLTISGGNLVLSGPNISGTLAARPAAGVANRVYLATDTNELYRDTGVAWVGMGVSWSNVSGIPSAVTTYAINLDQNVRTTDSPTFSRLTSTVATGTAPLTVASTTLVTNLNADLLDGQSGSYYQNASNINAGTLAVARGGTGLGTTPTNGQLLIGNGTGYTLAGITAGNGLSVTNGAGSITVAMPNVGTAATYGSASTVPVLTTDAQGRITGVVETTITPAWSNVTGKPTTLAGYLGADSADANPNVRLGSGFYQNSAASAANGWPVTTGGWYHLMAATHANTGNNYSMQLAADFFTQDLYYRSTNGSGATAWNKVLHSTNAPYALAMNQHVRTTDSPSFTNVTIGANQVLHAGNVGSYAMPLNGGVNANFDIASNSNTADYTSAAIELRELNHGGVLTGAWSESPRLSFHWGGRVASQIAMGTDGTIAIRDNPGTGYGAFAAGSITAAGGLTFSQANPIISSTSYVTLPGGLYVSGGTAYFQNQLQARGGVNNDSGNLTLSAAGGSVISSNQFGLAGVAVSGGACGLAGAIARDGANDVYVCK